MVLDLIGTWLELGLGGFGTKGLGTGLDNICFRKYSINKKLRREDIPSETFLEKYPGVPSCCGDGVGYMSDGQCTGTHEGGDSVMLKKFPVCLNKEHTGVKEVIIRNK